MRTTDFARALTEFLSIELPSSRNVSPNTVLSYRDTFKQLIIFMDKEKCIKPEGLRVKDISVEVIYAFLDDLEISRNGSIPTRNQRLAAIHSFFRYLQKTDPAFIFQCQQVLSIPFKKTEKKIVQFLSEDETARLLAAPGQSTKKNRRDTALLCLLYDSAARVQELADLKVKDIRLTTPAQVTLTGKGRKTRVVPLMDKTASIMREYMRENGMDELEKLDSPLFRNSRGEKLTRQGITYILKKYVEICKLPEISPHQLRHTKAMHLTEADINPFYIRDFLGHSDIKTTGIYARTSVKMKKAAMEKLNSSSQNPLPIQDGKKSWTEDADLMEWLKGLG